MNQAAFFVFFLFKKGDNPTQGRGKIESERIYIAYAENKEAKTNI